ncbi:hypothetical protein ACS0TY_036530 [Phlomoides rotata]
MKILCDVCEKDEASYYCVADEAALCTACDHRVHHANKLAGKHHRFSLLLPSPKQAPICDICQEKRAFLFCQQDRALLCKDCDVPIHKANEHTQKHTRFLLAGAKLSATSSLYSASSSSSDVVVSKPAPISHGTPSPAKSTTPQSTTSSISEYLMETLPGWHVEDLLDSSSPYQSGENYMMPTWDGDFQSVFPTENMGFWVPQVQPPPQTQNQSANLAFGLPNGFKDHQSKEFMMNNSIISTRKRSEDNSFAVPQITSSSTAIKRSRNFW